MNAMEDVGRPVEAGSARLLIVEDDGIVAMDLRRSLESLGYQVVDTIRKGDWAVKAVREHGPDLVLMDIRLAGSVDGVEAGEEIGQELGVPVVYLTAYADDDTRARVHETGPYGYLVKPYTNRDLQTAVEVALLRARMERRLRESERRFRQMAETVEEVFWLRDPGCEEMLYVSPAFETIWGRPCQAVYEDPRSWIEAIHPEDRGRIETRIVDPETSKFEEEYRVVRPDGEERWVHDQGVPVFDDDGDVYRMAGVTRDITERKRFEEQLQHRALHDYLTGLPNRALFRDRLEHAVERTERKGENLAVVFLDLKRFKVVNDSLGHDAGDHVLKEVARRLEAVVRGQDTVARIGGDEFTILLEDVETAPDAGEVADRLVSVFQQPVSLETQDIPIDASIGIAMLGEGEAPPPGSSDLIRWADAAMYRSKKLPGTRYVVADQSERDSRDARLERENRLRNALQEERIRTVYQPIYSVETGRIRAVEALARWHEPGLGEIPPGAFIPVAEETGLIIQLGKQQLKRACAGFRERWGLDRRGPDSSLRLHVNLSARQLEDPDLVERTTRILEETDLPPSLLCLEITESAAMRKPETVGKLKEIGIEMAIDDFGTRYSTLSQLRRLRVDALKIDRTFVAGLTANVEDRAIVETILTLGRSLGLRIVAEGIETADQLRSLQELGCDEAQGYHLARPQSPEELRSLLDPEKGDAPPEHGK